MRRTRPIPSVPAALLLSIAVQVGCAYSSPQDAPGASPSDPLAELIARFTESRADRVATVPIGRSEEGRPIVVLRAGAPDAPALLLVAGLDGRLRGGPAIALAALGALLDDPASPLSRAAIYVVPGLDPDGYARALTPRSELVVAGPLRPTDDDRDGLLDEDGPTDVDGDGVVSWMRVFDPRPPLARTHLVDPEDPRRSKEADRAKGEVPVFALIRESRDRDGDGSCGEDGIGSVELDSNFPHQYRENGERSGPWALSAAGSRALVDWMLTRSDIESVLALDDGDSLFDLPDAGKYDATNRAPLGLERGDAPFAEEVKKRCEAEVGWKKSKRAAIEGAFWSWAYAQYGALSFSLDVTRQPSRDAAAIAALERARSGPAEPLETGAPPAPPDPGAKQGEEPGGVPKAGDEAAAPQEAADRAKKGGKDEKKTKDLEAECLEAAAAEGWGFVAWREFAHPQLGRVEIGGLDDDFLRTPRPEAHPALGAWVGRIAAILLSRLPRLEVEAPVAERVGASVWRVRVVVRNSGGGPIPTAIGEKLRRRGSVSLRLELPRDRAPSGRLVQTLRTLEAAGGEGRAEWLVVGTPGETIRITLRAPQLGARELAVTLGNGDAR